MAGYNAVLITGATSGIGLELSRIFAKNGYNLVLVARNKERLATLADELKREFSINILIIQKDLSLSSAAVEILNELIEKKVHINILVNNAGFNEYGVFAQTDIRKELQMIQLNIASLTHLTKLVIPWMLDQKQGKILNVGSIGSFVPGPLNAVYCATKAYILSFSEAISEELKDSGISVTVLCPGPTNTEFAQRADMENTKLFKGKLMEAAKAAEYGYNSLMQNKKIAIPGCRNKLTVFFLGLLPRHIVSAMSFKMMQRI